MALKSKHEQKLFIFSGVEMVSFSEKRRKQKHPAAGIRL